MQLDRKVPLESIEAGCGIGDTLIQFVAQVNDKRGRVVRSCSLIQRGMKRSAVDVRAS